MRAEWHALHTTLIRSSNRHGFHRHFGDLCQGAEALKGVSEPAAVLDALHAPGGDPAAKNALLSALVSAAQAPGDGSEPATTLLILALWPGLDAVYGRLWRCFRREPELLVAEIAGRITQGIKRLDRDRVTWIAATLIRNTERDIRRMLARQWREGAMAEAFPEEGGIAVETGATVFVDAPCTDTDLMTVLLAERLRAIIGDDAALVMAIAVHGERQDAAAKAAGLSYEAARKRYQRALIKLRAHLHQ